MLYIIHQLAKEIDGDFVSARVLIVTEDQKTAQDALGRLEGGRDIGQINEHKCRLFWQLVEIDFDVKSDKVFIVHQLAKEIGGTFASAWIELVTDNRSEIKEFFESNPPTDANVESHLCEIHRQVLEVQLKERHDSV